MLDDCLRHTTRSGKHRRYSWVGAEESSVVSSVLSKGKEDHRKDWPHLRTAAKHNWAFGKGSAWNPAGTVAAIAEGE